MYHTRILIAVTIATLLVTDVNSLDCPLAFAPKGNSCVCADWSNGIVTCDNVSQRAFMQIGYCMTYNNATGEIRAGGCQKSNFRSDSVKLYYPLPTEVSDLNDEMCGPFNTKGLLCGECQDGFAISPLTTIHCINCTNTSNDWMKYLAVAYLPVTVMFTIITVFSLSFVSGPINSFIFFAQVTSLQFGGTFSAILSILGSQGTGRFSRRMSTMVITALYDVCNLNIFRNLAPRVCLSNYFNTLQAHATNYVLGFYPLLLVVFLYICIKLHARNFRPIVCCWKPFLKCFFYFRRSIDPKTSAIDAFATFTLLSYVKLLFSAGKLLIPQYLYTSQGKRLNDLVMAHSTNIQFFSNEHLPFAIFSIFVSLTFISVPPIVLLFYPTSFLQKYLTQCKMNSQALRTFVETFHGCYKNGTNGTRDCRYFAGLYFILRIFVVILTCLPFRHYMLGSALLYLFTALLFALVQPYKNYTYNVIDAVMFALMCAIFILFGINAIQIVITGHPYKPLLVLTDVLYALPLLCLVLCTAYWVLSRKTNFIQKLKDHKFVRYFSKREEFDAAVPHRLLNPEEYETLTDGSQVEYELF